MKFEIWNIYVKHLEFESLKTKMYEFGCVNTESWKLKFEICNLYVKCLESKILKTKMSKLGCVNT